MISTFSFFCVPYIISLIKKISEDVALSTGSACSAGEPSYVIQALGLADKVTKVLRVSINKYTTAKDIEKFVGILKAEI